MKLLAALLLLALSACPPATPPAPMPPDADAAPTTPQDASAPTTPCQAACNVLTSLCGAQSYDCVTVMSAVDGQRLKRNTVTGNALTCVDVASATSAAQLTAMGVNCP